LVIIFVQGGAGGGIIFFAVAIFGALMAFFGWEQIFTDGYDFVIKCTAAYIALNTLAAIITPKKIVNAVTTAITVIACAVPVIMLFMEGADAHWGWYIIGSALFLSMAAVPALISAIINYIILKIRGLA